MGAGCDKPTSISWSHTYEEARIKLKRGDLRGASVAAEDGLRHFVDADSEWHWRFTVLKGDILARQRLMKECLELLAPDLPGYLSKSDIAVLRKLTQGYADGFLGKLDESDQLFTEAEKLAKENHPELLGEVTLRKGTVAFFIRGDAKTAEHLFQATLQTARQQQDPFLESNALGSLGIVATNREHYDEAIGLFEQALKLSRSLGAQLAAAKTLGNMAWCYRELGDFENALAYDKEAEAESARIGLVKDQMYWLAAISNVYYQLRDYGPAEAALEQALGLARTQEDKRTLKQSLNALAEIALETGRVTAAEKYYAEASEVQGGGVGPSEGLYTLLVGGRIEAAKHDFDKARKSFDHLIQDPKANADAALRWEVQARLAEMHDTQNLPVAAEREYRQSLDTMQTARNSIERDDLRLSFLSGGIEFCDDYVSFLIRHKRTADALGVAELLRARTLEEGLSVHANGLSHSGESISPEQIARRFHVTILFYWIGQNHSYLWVITPAKTTHFELANGSQIEPVVRSYQKTVLQMRDAQDAGASDGKKLYTMLVEPAKKLIPKDSRVIVLPDESLYGLNFETLVVPDPRPHFWIEDVTLSTASSLTLLERSAGGLPTKEKNLLLVGNTEQANADFPPLPQAPAEMQKVGRYFPDAQRRVLAGKEATPSAYLRSNPERFAYLHFVTHGTASHTRPLESAVILSKEGDSYKLYARDIVRHQLNANLVTISACNGSGTRAYSGEGLVGLSWAFLRAGAHNVIGALWEVSDVSTPQLMDALYGELSEGKDPATALRDAKLRLLHSTDPRSVFKKPFYWAPFQLYTGS